MRLTLNLKTVLIAVAVLAASFFISLKAMDWLSPRATDYGAAGRAIAAAAAGLEKFDRGGAGGDLDVGDPRAGREGRAAQFRRQGR